MAGTAAARMPLIAGNWKMNLNHLEALALVQKVAFSLKPQHFEAVEVVVLPPFTDIRSVQTLVDGDKLALRYGAQDLSPHAGRRLHRRHLRRDAGQAGLQLRGGRALRAPRVPPRERRAGQRQGARGATPASSTPILCVGERLEVREAGEQVRHCVDQLTRGAGRRARRAGRRAWSSPTSRCGRSAPARWPPRPTPRRSARRSGAGSPSCTAPSWPPASGSCTAAR